MVALQAYLEAVLAHKEAIPYNQHKGGRGRHAQVRPDLGI
jgi:hypothetical protein